MDYSLELQFSKIHKRLDKIDQSIGEIFELINRKYKRGRVKEPIPKRLKKSYTQTHALRNENTKLHKLLAKQI